MAYIGAVAPGYDPTRASVPQLDAERFSGNASTTAFTLARQVVSPTDIDVVVENVTQEPTVAYSVNGNTLTFTEAPGSGTNNIYVVYRGSGISNYAFVPDGSITYAKLANNIKQFTVDAVTANGTGTTVELTEAPASANSIIVSVDGVIQTAPTNYTLSGSTITFTGTPDNGANVVVRHIGFRTTSTVTALQASSVTATEIADGSITNVKIVSVANTKISGNIVSSQITSVANTQITGTITGSQISSNTLSNTVFQTGSVENYLRGANLDFGMRNRIINGAMVIDQRNAGASVSAVDGAFQLDRWKTTSYDGSAQTGKFTVQQTPSATETGYATRVAAGFTNYLAATSSATTSLGASAQYFIAQNIEGLNILDLAWGTASAKTVTLSFYAYSSLTGTFGGSVSNSAANRSYPFTYSIPVANTWTQISVTIAGDTSGTWLTTNGIGLRLNFSMGSGTTVSGTAGAWAGAQYTSATGAVSVVGTNGATLYITGVQFEKGSTATSFDYRPYGAELQLCQRYFWRMSGVSGGNNTFAAAMVYGSTDVRAVLTHPVPMRTTVSVSITGTNFQYSNAGSLKTLATINAADQTPQTVLLYSGAGTTSATIGQAAQYVITNVDSYISVSAEL